VTSLEPAVLMASVVNLAGCLSGSSMCDKLRFQMQYSLARRSFLNFCQLLTLNSLIFPPDILVFDIGNDVVVWYRFANLLYRHSLKKDARDGLKFSILAHYLLPSVTES
jgi:hypothetical protein